MPAPARARKPEVETLALEERIRRRAYELYVVRGNESGSELEDWLQAEEEIQTAEEQGSLVSVPKKERGRSPDLG